MNCRCSLPFTFKAGASFCYCVYDLRISGEACHFSKASKLFQANFGHNKTLHLVNKKVCMKLYYKLNISYLRHSFVE